jgi:N-formylglutamate amidohydrolase
MKIISGSSSVPVIYTAHHASHDFREFDDRVALTHEQKVRFSDYGSDKTVPVNGLVSLVAEHSRALGDLNRAIDSLESFQTQDFSRPFRQPIWNSDNTLEDSEKARCLKQYYEPFHNEIISQLSRRREPTFVVAWDNTAHYEIGTDDAGRSVTMKPFILSNQGAEGSANARPGEYTSCDPVFLTLLAQFLKTELKKRDLPNEIHLNLVFRGGYICRRYSSAINRSELLELGIDREVQSLQVEYDTAITHDQVTLEEKPDRITALREAFSEAIEKSIKDYKNLQDN